MQLTGKKILITGAHGFLGKYVVKELLKHGCKQKDLSTPTKKEADLTKITSCRKSVKGMDIVIHLAGKVGGIGFNNKHAGEMFYDNIRMGIFLMDEARKANIKKFISIGTVCSYPKLTPIPFKEKDLWNGYPEETNAPYGLAKKMLLVQGQAYRNQYGFNSIYLMPLNLYGPGDNFNPRVSHVIPALIKKILDAKKNNISEITIWGTGKATRGFLYVEDAARGIIQATREYDKPEPINIGSDFEISIKDLASLLCRLTGFDGKIIWDRTKPDGQPRRKLDTSLAKKEFGFIAKTDFEEGLKSTIQWFKKSSYDANK